MFIVSLSTLIANSAIYADKQYYLVDSLVLSDLSESDSILLENHLENYHNATIDTIQIKILSSICNNMVHEVWKSYQFFLYEKIEQELEEKKLSNGKKKFLLRYKGNALNNMGFIFAKRGDISKALDYYNQSVDLFEKIGVKGDIATGLSNIGSIYDDLGNVPKAIEFYNKSLEMSEDVGNPSSMATSLNNLGIVYSNHGDIKNASKYYQRSLEILTKIGDGAGVAQLLSNIGELHDQIGERDKCLVYYTRALEIREEIGDKNGIAQSLIEIGIIHIDLGNIEQSLKFCNRALMLNNELGNKKGLANTYYNLGYLEFKRGNIEMALNFASQSLDLAQEVGFPSSIQEVSELLSNIYEKQNKPGKALDMYRLYITMRDSINNDETQKASIRQQAKYQYEKKKSADNAARDKLIVIEREKKKKQQLITMSTGIGLLIVSFFLVLVFKRLSVTKRQKLIIEQQKVQMESQKRHVEQQKDILEVAYKNLEQKNREIQDSIIYAQRIQKAILPTDKSIHRYLKKSFILYSPKDIVSSDFYWVEERDNQVFFAVADCSGSGVPGAMIGLVCNNALNRSINEYNLSDPGSILEKTHEIVINELEKSGGSVKDGMDITLCVMEGNNLRYAVANSSLWIIRGDNVIEAKSNEMPVGKDQNPRNYKTQGFELQVDDSIYLFSAGCVKQLEEEKEVIFKEFLVSIQDVGMQNQKERINKRLSLSSQGKMLRHDICIMGIAY